MYGVSPAVLRAPVSLGSALTQGAMAPPVDAERAQAFYQASMQPGGRLAGNPGHALLAALYNAAVGPGAGPDTGTGRFTVGRTGGPSYQGSSLEEALAAAPSRNPQQPGVAELLQAQRQRMAGGPGPGWHVEGSTIGYRGLPDAPPSAGPPPVPGHLQTFLRNQAAGVSPEMEAEMSARRGARTQEAAEAARGRGLLGRPAPRGAFNYSEGNFLTENRGPPSMLRDVGYEQMGRIERQLAAEPAEAAAQRAWRLEQILKAAEARYAEMEAARGAGLGSRPLPPPPARVTPTVPIEDVIRELLSASPLEAWGVYGLGEDPRYFSREMQPGTLGKYGEMEAARGAGLGNRPLSLPELLAQWEAIRQGGGARASRYQEMEKARGKGLSSRPLPEERRTTPRTATSRTTPRISPR